MLHLQQLSVISPEAYTWYRKRHSLRDIAQQPYQEMAYCVGRESNPGQLLGRQLCSPLYHQRMCCISVSETLGNCNVMHGISIFNGTMQTKKTDSLALYPSCPFHVKQGLEMDDMTPFCIGRESNPGQLLGKQLCSPLYHQCM